MTELKTIGDKECILFDTIEEAQSFISFNKDYKIWGKYAVYREEV